MFYSKLARWPELYDPNQQDNPQDESIIVNRYYG